MTSHFKSLLTVAIQHSYYASGCRDFEFIIPWSTAELLRGGNALARMRNGQLHLLFECDSAGLPLKSLAGRKLTFGLQLVNPNFSNFTSSVMNDRSLVPFYTNSIDPLVLSAPVGITLTSGMHEHTPLTANSPLTLRLIDSVGAIVATEPSGTSKTIGSFDLRSLGDGVYQIDEVFEGASVGTSQLFVSKDLISSGVWGIVNVTIDEGFYVEPPVLALQFTARQEQLKYFIVAKNFTANEFDQLSVSDKGFNEENRPQLTFERLLPPQFSSSDINPALLGDGNCRIVMFKSQVPVARRERGLRKIQLNRNGDVLVEHLPQPGADRSQAHLIVHLSKP